MVLLVRFPGPRMSLIVWDNIMAYSTNLCWMMFQVQAEAQYRPDPSLAPVLSHHFLTPQPLTSKNSSAQQHLPRASKHMISLDTLIWQGQVLWPERTRDSATVSRRMEAVLKAWLCSLDNRVAV